jgi:type II secretory pathway component GspD/PulD (secretin)
MKAANFITLSSALITAGVLQAQAPNEVAIEQVAPPAELSGNPPNMAPGPDPSAPTVTPTGLPAPADLPPPAAPLTDPAPMAPALPATPEAPAAPFTPAPVQKLEMEKSDNGMMINNGDLNQTFQFLAQQAGRQYFHNSKINGPDFTVTGNFNNGNPLQQMEELAFMYGLSLHTKGNTIYALTQAQLAQLPSTEFHYQLRYLRPTDIEQIKELIKPMLSPTTGIVNFEPKTNTVIIIDSAHRIEQARELLHGIDKAKGQIIVETKILRVNSTAAERTGVNWTKALGVNGTDLKLGADLNSVFGLPDLGGFPGNGANLILNSVQLTGVLRALAEGNLASQISNPTLITEDNEQANIAIIDRIPIITRTTTASQSGAEPTVTEQVRYKIDTSDPTIDSNPNTHREIGISLVVTPTLLPDGTIRMKMRPRSAQVTGFVTGQSGEFPRVTESMVESIARVPDGNSLVVGGFYSEIQANAKTKVPLLGDVPGFNFFFKSKENTKQKTSLVFIVTPKSYDPTNRSSNRDANSQIRTTTSLKTDYDWVDEDNPGPAHEPNLKRSIRGMKPNQAPYYPRAEELETQHEATRAVAEPSSTASKPYFSKARKH